MLRRTNRLATMLNRRVEVWHSVKSAERDRLGQFQVEDKQYCTMYACIIPQTGGLLTGRTADTALVRTTHKILTRYRADITPDMWIVADGVRYNILYIMDPNLDRERLEIFTEVLLV